MVEFALAAPVLVLLLLGTLDLTMFFSDTITVGTASREGARIASEIGAGLGGMTQAQADQAIVQAALTATSGINDASLQEIDVYAPAAADGSYNPVSDLGDEFDGRGRARAKQSFALSQRIQRVPDETSIGVRIVWQFVPPMGVGTGLLTFHQETVFRAEALPS